MSKNLLGHEKSPYLLQHRDNPVWWYPWGEEAFAAAERENKPIFLSIGYSTCYWCHVMEKDSFEKEDVAAVLNEHFISIKVDREERPDVDQLYMQAVVGLTGHGGWPMSVFLTPQREPFWGGTFFPRAQFLSILKQIHRAWTDERQQIGNSAAAITAFLKEQRESAARGQVSGKLLAQALSEYGRSFDSTDGGFGQAPKFPPSAQISLLLRIARRTKDATAASMAIRTLERMARGGLYDHIGGGFHRYSTDSEWLVPHFEKMLYDNALLVVSYLEAAQTQGGEAFAGIGESTLDYMIRDLRTKEGAFASAEDAGEVGKEGEFYVWTAQELRERLSPPQFLALSEFFEISETGNFEHGATILRLKEGIPWEQTRVEPISGVLETLRMIRSERPRPHLDDKVLTAWNALAISALAKGHQVLGKKEYLEAAQQTARFIRSALWREGKLLRRYRDGESRFDACLEDYAFLIAALVDLYQSDFDADWLVWARELQHQQDERFWDTSGGGYVFADSKDLIASHKEIIDGALPAGNSVAFLNNLRLYEVFAEPTFREHADALAAIYAGAAERFAAAVPKGLQGIDFMLEGGKAIVIIEGDGTGQGADLIRFVHRSFLPNAVLLYDHHARSAKNDLELIRTRTAVDGKTTVFVCRDQRCELPVQDTVAAESLIAHVNPLEIA